LSKLENGYIQVYTGDGKGKTTAALGLALRGVGEGLIVYIVQFLKSGFTGELESIKKLSPNLKLFRFEKPRNFFWKLNNEEKIELKSEVQAAFVFCRSILKKEECDILILDEILGAISNGLISETDLLSFMEEKPVKMELIITGRNASEKVIQKADLVTEMKEIKHYMNKGVPARKGIEF
jgi:cob(I)alamin adenosyltransferase